MGRMRFTVLISDRCRRSLVTMATAAFLVVPSFGVGMLVAASPAQAAPAMTFTPKGPFKGGEVVQVSFTGYAAGAPVAIGVCPQGRNVTGPGDCAPSKTGASRLVTADASGKGTGKITIPLGPLKNIKVPAESCGPAKADGCTMGASAIDGSGQAPIIVIKYAAAAAPTKTATKTTTKTTTTAPKTTTTAPKTTTTAPTTTGTTTGSGTGTGATSATGSTPTGTTTALPKTGPRETALVGFAGLLLLQIGLIFAVRAVRASPRRMSV